MALPPLLAAVANLPKKGETIALFGPRSALKGRRALEELAAGRPLALKPALDAREARIVLAGGVVNVYRRD